MEDFSHIDAAEVEKGRGRGAGPFVGTRQKGMIRFIKMVLDFLSFKMKIKMNGS